MGVRMRQLGGFLVLFGLVQAIAGPSALAQTNLFFYDNLGRIAVVLSTNKTNAAFYDYDAVGNITAIRTQAVSTVNLFEYSPATATGNTTLTLQGTGFSTTLASNTVVFCNTITAQVISATSSQLKVLAPTNAVNCIIKVTTPSGSASNATAFSTGLGVSITPASTNLFGSFSAQFTATVFGTTNQNVTWNINGWIPAGTNTAWGIVTTNGLYTAPLNPSPAAVVLLHARSATSSDPVLDAVATITLSAPLGPIYSPTISMQAGVPAVLGPVISPTVSAEEVPNTLGPVYSPTVSAKWKP